MGNLPAFLYCPLAALTAPFVLPFLAADAGNYDVSLSTFPMAMLAAPSAIPSAFTSCGISGMVDTVSNVNGPGRIVINGDTPENGPIVDESDPDRRKLLRGRRSTFHAADVRLDEQQSLF